MRPAAVPTFQGRARELGRPGSWPWRLRRARGAVPLPGRPGFGGPLTELDREERQEPQAGHPPRARPGEHVLPPGPPGRVSAVGGTGVRAGGQALCRGAPAWHPEAPPGGSTTLLHGRSFLLTGNVLPCGGWPHTAPGAGVARQPVQRPCTPPGGRGARAGVMRRGFWGDAGACVSSMLTVVVPAGTHVRLSGARPPHPPSPAQTESQRPRDPGGLSAFPSADPGSCHLLLVPAANKEPYRAPSNLKAEGGSWSESPWDRGPEGTVALRGRPV